MDETKQNRLQESLGSKSKHRFIGRDLREILRMFRRVNKHRRLAVWLMLAILLSSVLSLPTPIILQKVVDAISSTQPFENIIWWMLAGFVLLMLSNGISLVTSYFQMTFSMRFSLELRRKVFRAMLNAPWGKLARLGSGDLLTRLTVDVDEVGSAITGVLPVLLTNLTVMIGSLAVMFYLSTSLTLFALIIVPTFFLISMPLTRRIRDKAITARSQESSLNDYMAEAIHALGLAKAFARERSVERRVQRLGKRAAFTRRTSMFSLNVAGTMLGIVSSLGPLLVLGIGGYLASAGQLSTGSLLGFYASFAGMLMRVQSYSFIGLSLGKSMAAINRINECMNLPAEDQGEERPESLLPLKTAGVKFRYSPENELLRGVDLRLFPGDRLGIVGVSGAGKSTLLTLMAGLLAPDEGDVLLAGRPSRDVDRRFWRRGILLVAQDQPFLGMTAEENLKLGEDKATTEQMWHVLSLVGLAETIRKLPLGLNEPLGETAGKLSGGERARLCLARAILARPQALLLDEPFASLDTSSAVQIWRNLEMELPDTALVLVSHHLEGLSLVSRVAVLHEGRIVEEGVPEELAGRDSYYSRLCKGTLLLDNDTHK